MTWTCAADLRAQTQKLWDQGVLLRALLPAVEWQPRRLRLLGPTSGELGERFEAVRVWLDALRGIAHVRIVWREFDHRLLGTCTLPEAVWLDTPHDALALIGKRKESRRFEDVLQATQAFDEAMFACLQPWLAKRPLVALALADDWLRLLQVLAWLQSHPRPGIYLRQVDLHGIDSKFIEAQRSVLTELLDLVLPPGAIEASATGINQFCRRYGFRDKPLRIRLRVLDAALALPCLGADQDITLTQADFAQLEWRVHRVFITENEVNFLAFPPMPGSVVIFGAGYGFEALAGAPWLQRCTVFYWGDIDTHGFAILDQLRAQLPHAQSLLMDRSTLLAHQSQWVTEPQPTRRSLTRLTTPELALYNDLQGQRLEQERIQYAWVKAALAAMPHSAMP